VHFILADAENNRGILYLRTSNPKGEMNYTFRVIDEEIISSQDGQVAATLIYILSAREGIH
jgi:hypothetical protein